MLQKLEKHFGDAIVIQCQQGQDMSNIVYNSSIVSLKLSTRPTVWRLIQVEHFLMYQQVFLNGGNKLIECIFMLWHRRLLDLCFSISKQISCYTRWMIQSIFDYHKSCYKAFTSKHNLSTCSNFKSTCPTSASCNQNQSSNEDHFTIVTRSRASEISIFDKFFRRHFISLSDICSTTRLIRWVLFSDKTLCIFLLCLKALCLQIRVITKLTNSEQSVQSISEALDRVTIVKWSSFDDGFWLHDAEVGHVLNTCRRK
jgi:hypothetical protein